MSRFRLSRRARIIISVLMLVGLIWWAGPRALLESLAQMRWGWLLLSVLVNYVAMSIGALNVAILTRALLPATHWTTSLRAFLRSWAVGMVAPGKFGDLTYAHFLSDDETNLAPGLAVAVVDKIVTFVVTSAIAVVGLAVYVGAEDAAWGAGFAIAATALVLVVLFEPRLRRTLSQRFLSRYAEKFAGLAGHLRELLLVQRGILALNVGLTILRMLVISFVISLEFRALNVAVPLLDVVVVQAVTQLVSLVPITLGGLGVRQGVSVVLFERISGILAAPVLNQGLILTFMSYTNVAIIFAALGMSRADALEAEEGLS